MKLINLFKKEEARQFIRFCIVGVFGGAFTYAVFVILFKFFKFHYIPASATGFILGVFFVFFLNKNFTFRVYEKRQIKSMMIKYYGVNLFSLVLGMIALAIFVEIFLISPYISNIFILGITTLSNFFGSKFIVFKK